MRSDQVTPDGANDRITHRKTEEMIMKFNTKFLGALAALAVLAGVAVAIQFSGSAPPTKLIMVDRLPGTWVLDADITARLDPQRGFTPPRGFEFVKDDTILPKLQAAYPRFKNESIYLSGTANMGPDKHWFILLSSFGNTELVLFTPTREGPVGEPHYLNVNMAYSRDPAKDLLFVGGDVPRDSAAAYAHVAK
jgi:hypothetical protein